MNKEFISCLENLTSLACNQATILSTLIKIEAAITKNSNAIKFLTLAVNPKNVLNQRSSKQSSSSVPSKFTDSNVQTDTPVGKISSLIATTSASEFVDKIVDLQFPPFNPPSNLVKTSTPLALTPLDKPLPINPTSPTASDIQTILNPFLADMKEYFCLVHDLDVDNLTAVGNVV